jgi:osmotically-inducible protein OsmY
LAGAKARQPANLTKEDTNMKSNYSLALIVVAGSMLINTAPLQASEADKNIDHEISDLLLANNSLAPTDAKFVTVDGVVTISGTSCSLDNEAQLDSAVGMLPGVQHVVDNRPTDIVAQSAPESTATSREIDDASLTDEVKSALMSHDSTRNTITQVTTKNGVVTITGIAKNEGEKTRATQLAAAISGVTSVINNMTVAVPVAAN